MPERRGRVNKEKSLFFKKEILRNLLEFFSPWFDILISDYSFPNG